MERPDLKNLPDPYLPDWQQSESSAARELRNRAADRAEIRTRRRRALEDFERRLAERDRLDRITLRVCAVLLIVIPAIVIWWNT